MKQHVDFDDIFDVWQPMWWENPWAVAGVVAGAIFLLFLMFQLVKKYWLQKKPIDPRTWALQQLYAINPEHVVISKEFYTQILLIMKHYLDTRYGLQSASKTDSELGDYIAAQGPQGWVPAIKHIAQRSVTIKFAQENTEKDNLFSDYERVLDVLKQDKMHEKQSWVQ